MTYVGRFAPSPTGDLHLGSLLAAVGSYAQALLHDGRWLIRIEDIDPARQVPGAVDRQINDLKRFGMVSAEPVILQSQSRARHDAVIDDLMVRGLAFNCGCSRADLPASGIYPGTCRNGVPAGKDARSIRFRVPDDPIQFNDAVFGQRIEQLSDTVGDFVIRRADGLVAYQLAVVVDDIDQGVTEVVRGADLLGSTARQIALWQALGAEPPSWLHLPLVVDQDQQKLGKSTDADPVHAQPPLQTLKTVLHMLGQQPPEALHSIDAVWQWVRGHWQTRRIPSQPIPSPGR